MAHVLVNRQTITIWQESNNKTREGDEALPLILQVESVSPLSYKNQELFELLTLCLPDWAAKKKKTASEMRYRWY